MKRDRLYSVLLARNGWDGSKNSGKADFISVLGRTSKQLEQSRDKADRFKK